MSSAQPTTRRSNQARSEATRAALMRVARELFVNKGYAETGTPEIVAGAAVTRGALYHHFADKTDLFRAVVQAEALAVAQHIESGTDDEQEPLESLLAGAGLYFEAMAVPGRTRLLLLDGPAVLGPLAMARIDRDSGGASLREGLMAALGKQRSAKLPTQALADMLSAGFDRAALAIADGASAQDFVQALRFLLRAAVAARV